MLYQNIEKRIVDFISDQLKNEAVNNLVNIHRLNTQNSGDLMCAPYLYFEELRNESYNNVDAIEYLSKNFINTFSWINKIKNSNVVLGGGGMLDRTTFNHMIDVLIKLKSKGRKVVLWGVGHNNPSLMPTSRYYEQIRSFDVVGVRDYNVKGVDWVPCVSCMNSVLENDYKLKREFGIIEHEHIVIEGAKELNFPILKNKHSFGQIIQFIGETEYVITNSYHVMYWSILMKRKVLVIPNSSKMTSFKYSVPLLNHINEYKNQIKNSFVYTDALEDCRESNIQFSERVFNYLNL